MTIENEPLLRTRHGHQGQELCVPAPLESALQLLSDSSHAVRLAAIKKIGRESALFPKIPDELAMFILQETHPSLVSAGLVVVGHFLGSDPGASNLLLHYLTDSSPTISSTARYVLASREDYCPEVAVPLKVFGANPEQASQRRSIEITAGGAEPSPRLVLKVAELRELIVDGLRCARRGEAGAHINDATCWATAWGLCDLSLNVHELSQQLLVRGAKSFTPFQRTIIEGACAFICRDALSNPTRRPSYFLESLRELGFRGFFPRILQSIDCGEEQEVSLKRDFTVVYLSRDFPLIEGLQSLRETLWDSDPAVVLSAASNLGILVSEIPTEIGERVLADVWQVLSHRSEEGRAIREALVEAFKDQSRYDEWVLRHCGEILANHHDSVTHEVIAQILVSNPPRRDEYVDKVRGMLRYLAGSEFSLVAEIAREALLG